MVGVRWSLVKAFLKRRGSPWPSFITVVSTLGVAVGVAAFVVVVTIFNSFEKELKTILFSVNPNLIVFQLPGGIPKATKFMEELGPAIPFPIKSMSLFEYSENILGHEGFSATAIFRGIEGERSAGRQELEHVVHPLGALSTLNTGARSPTGLPAVILGHGLSMRLSAQVGSRVRIVSLLPGQRSHIQEFEVTGLLKVGLSQYDERLALINFDHAVSLFGRPGYAKGVEVRFQNPNDALAASQALKSSLRYQVRSWQEIDAGLFEQIERDGFAIKLIVLIITLVSGFNIVVTLLMGVTDRSRQIALLRSLGASSPFIISTFVGMALVIGAIGAVLGCGGALVVLKIFSGFELGELQKFYFLEKIPVQYDVPLMVTACGVALGLSFFSALYPAWKATLVSPLHGLKPGY